MDVILASHAHHVPHVGLPQIEPVTKAIILKTNPEGAKLFDIKKKFLILKIQSWYIYSSRFLRRKVRFCPKSYSDVCILIVWKSHKVTYFWFWGGIVDATRRRQQFLTASKENITMHWLIDRQFRDLVPFKGRREVVDSSSEYQKFALPHH